MIERTSLNPKCCVWVNFLKSRLMPTTHRIIVRKERLLLLHSIMKGFKINVGAIICEEVHKCTKKNSKSLIFLNLIIAMCLQAKVPLEENEDVIENKGSFTKQSVVRI